MAVPIAHEFVLTELLDSRIGSRIRVKPMFGSHGIYIDDKIVFILRHREDGKTERDNGVWVVAHIDHVDSVLKEFKELRPIEMFKKRVKAGIPTWNNLPETSRKFEEVALALCQLAIDGDERLGRIPGQRKPKAKSPKKKKSAKKVK